jgi:hypothetical protein
MFVRSILNILRFQISLLFLITFHRNVKSLHLQFQRKCHRNPINFKHCHYSSTRGVLKFSKCKCKANSIIGPDSSNLYFHFAPSKDANINVISYSNSSFLDKVTSILSFIEKYGELPKRNGQRDDGVESKLATFTRNQKSLERTQKLSLDRTKILAEIPGLKMKSRSFLKSQVI